MAPSGYSPERAIFEAEQAWARETDPVIKIQIAKLIEETKCWLKATPGVSYVNQNIQVKNMSNYTANNSQIGAMGENASASDFTQIQHNAAWPEGYTGPQVAEELSKLRKAMKAEAQIDDNPDLDAAIGHVAQAEGHAKNDDPGKTMAALKAGGKFVLDFAGKVGASFLVEYLKSLSSM